MRYLSAGDGPDVVLLHGGALGYSGDVWRGNMEAIAERGFRTLALDLPGYGGSDPLERNSDEATKGSVRGFVDSLAVVSREVVDTGDGRETSDCGVTTVVIIQMQKVREHSQRRT